MTGEKFVALILIVAAAVLIPALMTDICKGVFSTLKSFLAIFVLENSNRYPSLKVSRLPFLYTLRFRARNKILKLSFKNECPCQNYG